MRLITGCDGSLGSTLMSGTSFSGGLANDTMRAGKEAIEVEIDALLAGHSIFEVVNNFGVNHLSWIGTTPEEDGKIFEHNVMTAYWVINALVERKQTCRVINIASATYRVPQRCTAIYCASKAALVQMTKVMARELAPKGWVINCLAPGLIRDTTMSKMTDDQVMDLRGWSEEEMNGYATKLVPMGRPTYRKEVAEAIERIFKLPDYINGSVIDMMGGV